LTHYLIRAIVARELSIIRLPLHSEIFLSALRSLTLSLDHFPLSSIFCILFQVRHPATPLFAALRKTAGCVPTIPILELPTHLLATQHSSFATLLKLFVFKLLSTLLHDGPRVSIFLQSFRATLCMATEGVGVHPQPSTGPGHLTDEAEANEDRANVLIRGCGRFPPVTSLTSLGLCPVVAPATPAQSSLFGPYRPGQLNQTRRVVS
jgi:hypothetical protein